MTIFSSLQPSNEMAWSSWVSLVCNMSESFQRHGSPNYNTNVITERVLDVLKVQSRLSSDFQPGLYS